MTTATWVIIIGLAIIAEIIITYYLFRWIFSVKRQLWNQRQTINVLIRIAKKLGIDEYDEQLQDIGMRNNNPNNSQLK